MEVQLPPLHAPTWQSRPTRPGRGLKADALERRGRTGDRRAPTGPGHLSPPGRRFVFILMDMDAFHRVRAAFTTSRARGWCLFGILSDNV